MLAITGASGAVYGVQALEILAKRNDVETHLVLSTSGTVTLREELGLSVDDISGLAHVVHRPGSIGASIASGSFPTKGMLIAPCSIKTLSAIAASYSDNLITRAADVTLKEGRPLVLMVRETPLHLGHLRQLTLAAEAGAIIAPPVPSFYNAPATLEEMVEHTVRRALGRLGLPDVVTTQWTGMGRSRRAAPPASDT